MRNFGRSLESPAKHPADSNLLQIFGIGVWILADSCVHTCRRPISVIVRSPVRMLQAAHPAPAERRELGGRVLIQVGDDGGRAG